MLASDETSMRVGKKTFWTWVFHHADSACFVIRPSRGKAVVRAFQRRWRQSRVSGEGDPETVSAVHEVARLTQADTQQTLEP